MIWMSVKSLGSYEPCKGTQKSLPHHHLPKIYCRLIVRSSRGTLVFQRWKAKFPSLENYFSSLGNLIFQGWKIFGNISGRFLSASLLSPGTGRSVAEEERGA